MGPGQEEEAAAPSADMMFQVVSAENVFIIGMSAF